ncbi:microtubule associated protein-domain-containing protein [Phyllosticta citribraziliensis]|uniref:Microtubule associated protein-domain-containing protein n=1 Tax=Phyllosticta citribraziliensis TaxID=989973 RepID=A0ABR1L6T5_9PEZI
MDTSYLAQQVTSIIGQLHGLFDDIGVSNHDRDAREAELFSALSETLQNQLKLVTSEKQEAEEECRRLIKTIKQLQASLEGRSSRDSYDPEESDVRITYPLSRCLQTLKERHKAIAKAHRERFEQVKKLAQALESYASHLEPSFPQIQLPPTSPNAKIPATFDVSPNYIEALDQEFSRVYEEYTRRVAVVQTIAQEIIQLWAELGTPQAQTDSNIVEFSRDAPEQLGLHIDDVERLRMRKDKLVEEKRGRERRLNELRKNIEGLWDRLGVEEPDRKNFLANNRGCGLRTINEYEDELSRLNELKRQNLHLFVEDARDRLQQLWDSLYFSEEEMLDFTPAFSDVYSDALLSAHEAEIERLEALKEQRAPVLTLVDRHRSLVNERDELNAASQDASRLMARGQKGERRDPGKLLREEKMRKRTAKELPKVEAELRQALENWEDEYGRPFLVHGERYLEEIEAASAKAPARSKTPGAGSTTQRPTLHKQSKSASGLNERTGTISRAGSVRSAQGPPSRSKTPVSNFSQSTANFGSSRADYSGMSSISRAHNPFAQSTSSMRSTSPTKSAGGRAPLRSMRDGNNSIDRRQHPVKDTDTIRGNPNRPQSHTMGPPRAPPPKMKDLFSTPGPDSENHSQLERSSSIVRSMAPEDPYEDSNRSYLSFMRPDSAMSRSTFNTSVLGAHHHPMAPPPLRSSDREHPSHSSHLSNHHFEREASSRPDSARTSNTSSTVQTGASENWETYSDVSSDAAGAAPEPDASEAYYAKLRGNGFHGTIKAVGGGGGVEAPPPLSYVRGPKKTYGGIRGAGAETETTYEDVDGRLVGVVKGSVSDAGWTDADGDDRSVF